MKKRTFKRLAAALLTGAMMVGMMGMSVCAEGTTDTSIATITKTVEKEANAYVPVTEYEFTISNGEATTEGSTVIYAGITDGALFVTGENTYAATKTIVSTPTADDITKTELTYSADIKVDITKFNAPGVYRYVITETNKQADGVVYDTTRTLDAYIVNGTNGLEIATLVMSRTEGNAKGEFVNEYTTHNLTITKTVTGNQGDTNKEFEFPVTLTGTVGEMYYVAITVNGTTTNSSLTVGSDGTVSETFKLADGDSVVIYGLSANDKYTVSETDCSDDGYTTSVVSAENTIEGNTVTSEGMTSDESVAYTNDKSVTAPTGVILTFAPYILMVALAAAVAFVFLRRRSREF